MIVKPIPTWAEGNRLYPLPPDYNDLNEEGQRLARINGCRQWMIPYDTIAKLVSPVHKRYADLSASEKLVAQRYKQEALVASVYLFDTSYLKPTYDDSGSKMWDPLFYKGYLPRPRFHDDVLRAHAINRYGVEVEPRGGGKTTNLSVLCLTKFVSCPGREIVYCTASHPLAEGVGGRIKQQLTDNALLVDDWAPEYDGPIRPNRGEGSWGTTFFTGRNYSTFRVSSVDSVQRGIRADDYFLDDPEWDASASTDMQITRDDMEQLIKHVIIPMVTKPGASLWWQGTFVSQRHYLWAVMENRLVVVNGKTVEVPAIADFEPWHRKAIDVINETPEGQKSIWPEMWPLDDKDKEERKLPPETITLVELEKSMGSSAFAAEMRARPGTGGAAYFGELNEELHGWWLKGDEVDDAALAKPCFSKTPICWWREGVKKEVPLSEFLASSRVFITLDHAYTEKVTSDFKVCTCMAVTDTNELFVLDTWGSNTVPVGGFVQQAFQMAERWGAAALCPEKVKEGYALVAALNEVVRTRANDVMGTQYLVPIRPISVGTIDKTAKISALLMRFENGKIKLPMFTRGRDRWRPMFNQIRDFNPNVKDGGLKKDDFIDTVAMSQFVTQLPPKKLPPKTAVDDMLKRWRKGERVDSSGIPLIYYLPKDLLTDEDLKCLTHPPESNSPKPTLM